MWFSKRNKPIQTKEVPVAGGGGFAPKYGLSFTRHAQPDPGMAAVSYDTLALPLYSVIGWGVHNKRQFRSSPSNGVVYQNQAIALTTVGNPGNLSGSFVSTGLLDTTSAPGDLAPYAIGAPGSFQIPQGF